MVYTAYRYEYNSATEYYLYDTCIYRTRYSVLVPVYTVLVYDRVDDQGPYSIPVPVAVLQYCNTCMYRYAVLVYTVNFTTVLLISW